MMEPQATDSQPRLPKPPQDPPDGDLVRRVIDGHQNRAFDELIVKYQRQAVAVSYRLLGNTHDALEVTQDAFIKAFTNLHKLQKPEAFAGWLMRIVANLSLNYRRGRKNRGQLPLDDVMGSAESSKTTSVGGSEWTPNGFDPVRRLESAEMGQKLVEALKTLPEKQRIALAMFTVDELPQKQIAVALGCSVEAVKWH